MSEIITQDEFNKLMVAAVNTAPKKGLSEKQLFKFYEWAQYVRMGSQILEGILSGEIEMFSLNKDGSPGIVRPTPVAADLAYCPGCNEILSSTGQCLNGDCPA